VIDTVLRMRGLPDVTDYVDVDSVAKPRPLEMHSLVAGQLTYAGVIAGSVSVNIIKKACGAVVTYHSQQRCVCSI
jgi:hypothetical protein